jgi:phosphohistidine phosphatase
MKRLSILRHAKAAPHDSAKSDFDRPLAPRGQNQVADFCRWAGDSFAPDAVYVSTALRTVETYERLQEGLGRTLPAKQVGALYLAEVEDLLAAARGAGDAAEVLLIGHNPGLEDLAARLTGKDLELPTCGFVRIDLPIDDWSQLHRDMRGTLVEFREP